MKANLHLVTDDWGRPERARGWRDEHDREATNLALAVDLAAHPEELKQRVDALAREVQSLALQLSWRLDHERSEEIHDARLAWCEAHLDELAVLGRSHVAVHPTRGIVASSKSLIDLQRQLHHLPEQDREEILLVHTSQFV